MSDVVIEARGLTKRYGDVTALERASFEVRKGEVLGFLGPNGAGKTTTMKILTGFIAPTEGSAVVGGHDVFADPLGARRALGYLPESNPLYVEMLVLEYLEWVARMRGIKGEDARKRMRKIVDETSLGDVIAKEIRALSKGYRQRVGLAAALMHEPPILILDEPMSGLDPNQAVEIRELIKEIGRERTVILSTHNLFEVQLTCDRVLIVARGKIVADDRPDDLRARGGKPRYLVAVAEEGAGGREAVREKLAAVDGVASASAVVGSPSRELHFEVIAGTVDDLRAALHGAVTKAGLTLLELYRKSVDLELVFRDLTLEPADPKKDAAKKKKADAKKADGERKADAKKAGDDDAKADAKKAGDDDAKAGDDDAKAGDGASSDGASSDGASSDGASSDGASSDGASSDGGAAESAAKKTEEGA